MYDYFKRFALKNEDELLEKRVEDIKAAVLSRIKEEKPMKHFSVKPLIIAVAATVGTAASLVTANAATGGVISDSIHKTISFLFNGKQIEAEYTSYTDPEGNEFATYEFDIPEGEENNAGFYIVKDENGDDTKAFGIGAADGQDADVKIITEDENGELTEAAPDENLDVSGIDFLKPFTYNEQTGEITKE